MTIMKRIASFAAALGLAAFAAAPAMAATTFQAYETTLSVVFNGNGGPGSTITVRAELWNPSNHAQKIGTKEEFCQITGYNQQGEQLLFCNETLTFTGKGSLWAAGQINRNKLEAYQPQTIGITSGSGIYAGKTGTQTIKQVVYPDEFLLTIVLY